jgi:prevent-host-death family protein
MQVTVREARERLAQLLNAVASGDKVEITRRGKVIARLSPPGGFGSADERAREREALRAELPPASEAASILVRRIRDERG